ncbi:MAG: hypothetical protein Q8R56_18090 [Polaromonas sp.]|nr:hypothetical protein [Polaromonas sp.]
MTAVHTSSHRTGGIRLRTPSTDALAAASRSFLTQLAQLGLQYEVDTANGPPSLQDGVEISFHLRAELAEKWAPGLDTAGLTSPSRPQPDQPHANANALDREILLAMLLSPVGFEFAGHAELASAVRIRRNLVVAARQTALAFHTTEVDRPEDCWRYDEDSGFTVRPGHALIASLQKATQPDTSGKRYSFSCYRATEYVILLAIAQELEFCNPALLDGLQQQWERRAIASGQFHDVFLREYGSMQAPLPPRYYVPGDRLWFRNPDAHSSDVSGYEGSWVFYLGGGLFTNFWKREQPYTLTAKCLELFHWRHATYRDAAGELRIDEGIVEERVKASMADPAQVAQILELMLRLREPRGVYQSGGCIDTSREYPRGVCPGSADLVLPAA